MLETSPAIELGAGRRPRDEEEGNSSHNTETAWCSPNNLLLSLSPLKEQATTMSTKEDSSSTNKRGGGTADETPPATKRQRTTKNSKMDSSAITTSQQQMLEQKEKDLLDGIEGKEQELSRLKHRMEQEILRMKVQLEQVKAQLVSVKEQPAKEERQRRREGNKDPRIDEALLSIHQSGVDSLVDLLEHKFPDLLDEPNFWWALYDECDQVAWTAKPYEILKKKQPPTVLNNKAFVLQNCRRDPYFYLIIPPDWQLRGDTEIVETVVEMDPNMVIALPDEVQLENPRLVGRALARLPLWQDLIHNQALNYMADSAWRNRNVVLGWVKGGGKLHGRIPQSLRADQGVLLTAIRTEQTPTDQFISQIPNQLWTNKGFMVKVVEKNPFGLAAVAENLWGDRDLVFAALSGKYGVLAREMMPRHFLAGGREPAESYHRRHQFWIQMNAGVCQQLRTHDAFVKLVLGSIDLSQTKPSALAVLDHGGKETVMARKKLIAEFAGIPVGDELTKLRKARMNLAAAGIRWSD